MNSVETESVGIKRGHTDDVNGGDHLKKSKQDDAPPSKVIHIRQLPPDVQETEVKALGLPFGRVTNCLLMRAKWQAFIELEDVDCAKSMIKYYQYSPPTVRNKQVFLQYSQHEELRVNKQDQQNRNDDQYSNTSILKVIVNNIVYPVTVDVLKQVFQRCGEILKIVTFVRNDQYHALIQYAKAKDAAAARSQFDNQNIYNGCNMLRVDFSKMTELTVKQNNDKMRDFTKPDPPSFNNDQNSMNGQLQAINPGMLPIPNQFQPQMLSQGFGINDGGFGNIMGNMNSNNSMNFQPHGMGRDGGGMPDQHGSVLIVSNLVEGEVSCDDIFILFGHYGDVQRVKILFNKKDTALIKFSDANQANTALVNLNNVTLCGKELRVNRSKHDTVNMPRASDDGKEFTKDYEYSRLHRFKNPGSKNYQNIFPPIRTLHLSNIPETTPEDELQELFTEYGSISNFRFFPKDRKMALIQLGSVDEAVTCLIKVHNKKMDEKSHLRVSFAKNEMQYQ